MHGSSSVPGYLTIKEAAAMLGLSASRVYEYVEDGRLPSVRAAHIILIPVDKVRDFKPGIAGRPRQRPLRWRTSPENNYLFSTSITVRVRAGQDEKLTKRLEEIRKKDQHLFPGTIARFIIRSSTLPEQLEILFVWRGTVAPDEATHSEALAEFYKGFADVLDWDTAQHSRGYILMHT
jgi:excisionase family DNA binding protein